MLKYGVKKRNISNKVDIVPMWVVRDFVKNSDVLWYLTRMVAFKHDIHIIPK